MATYKEKVGTAVINFAGNYPGAVDGQLWYDSTNAAYKYQFPNQYSLYHHFPCILTNDQESIYPNQSILQSE